MSKNTEDINKKFEKAASKIKESNLNLDNDTLLTLYGYYKQATEGDCNIEAPSFFDFKGKAKYDAWLQHKGVGQETAMKKYIKKVKSLLENN
jgi:diazepam-binding inhibitor (GABA receptor modulating acyl-CoA-binding protein)